MSQNYEEKMRSELLNYDKGLHQNLLDQQEISLTADNDQLDSKLRIYSIILTAQLHWEIKFQYLELLDKFIEQEIDISEFLSAFNKRYQSIEKVVDILKDNRVFLSPEKNCVDFLDLLSDIDDCGEGYSDDPEPFRTEFDIGSVEFRTLINKIYSKIQNLLNEE